MKDLSENFSKSWEFLIKLFRDAGNLIILIILNIIPIINLIVIGYGARIIKEGDILEEPPKIDKYGEAFIDGLKVAISVFIYSLIPAIIAGVSIGLEMLVRPNMWMYGTFISLIFLRGTVLLGLAIATIIGFIIAIFGAMGIIHMIKTNDFGKIFAYSEILSLIEKVGWTNYIIWLIIIFVINLIIVSLASSNYIISAIIGVFYIVFVSRSAHYIYPEEEISGLEEEI